MTTVQNRHCYARLYLCEECLQLAGKNHEVYLVPMDKKLTGRCEVCGETKKIQEVFTTAFHYGI
ncbi:hypothetical protein [Zhaonella formicivorans]|uniref:hypothetical protein n=1 Tax=Zhaonella formicivorans TaxID=2528593 RepID=UPI0010D0DEB7|nr:hypothetical protein [Zhaonella formicivorans]